MKKKIIAILCAIAMLLPMAVLPSSAATNWKDDSYWTNYTLKNTPDYSFAVIGDIQYLTAYDVDKGHHYTRLLFDWIMNNRNTRNIQYVFGLGDSINTLASWPEGSYSTSVHNPAEWKIAADQFARFDGVIPYMVIRGNHDDEAGFHKYICTTDYQNQMSGFFYDDTKPAKDGNSMSNSFRKITIGNEKYLMLGLDYNIYNNKAVRDWANDVIAANPDYKVIVSIHAYYTSSGALLDGNIGEAGTDQSDGNEWTDFEYFSATQLWNEIFSKHANIAAILCGHASVDAPVVKTRTGNNGNKVIEILVDPQDTDDQRKLDGIKRCGFVLMLNFSNGGKTMELEYISTVRSNYPNEFDTTKCHFKSFQSSSAVIQTVNVTTSAPLDPVYWESVVKDLNIPVYVGAPMKNAPTLDGTVNEREYSYKKYYAPDDIPAYSESETQSGITEYIAHDADYVYYAVSFTQEADNRALQWQFNPLNSFGIFNNKTNLKNTLFQRVSWQLRYQSDGTVTVGAPHWNYSMSETLPVVGTDLQYEVTKTEDNVKTYEIKLSKDYLAEYNNCNKEDIRVIPYMTICHELTYIDHNYTQAEVDTLKSYGATRADLGSAPTFMVLEESPDAIQNVIKPTTQDGASVRISEENNGLRFKTTVPTAQMDELVAKYGSSHVFVGTLIAPADMLGTSKLTHSFGTAGVNYIDVKADVLAPFSEADGVRTYAGAISKIHRNNLDRDFVARGYIYYVDLNGVGHYIYSDTTCTRNVDYVATKALENPDETFGAKTEEDLWLARAIAEKLTVKYWNDILSDPFGKDPF